MRSPRRPDHKTMKTPEPSSAPGSTCGSCPARTGALQRLGLGHDNCDFVIALAGNPNTGKSTVFNQLTGLRQHTGNWPGKTITRAEGGFSYEQKRYRIVDLPGTYSLLSASPDEEVARDFILFGRPDVTVIVADATCLERNLNLVLQILQITTKAVLCLNLMDEARASGIEIDDRGLARDLGIPVVACAARKGQGMLELLAAVHGVATGEVICRPRRLRYDPAGIAPVLDRIIRLLEQAMPGLPHAPWIAMRLLEGDPQITQSLESGELAELVNGALPGDLTARPAPA